MHGRLGFRVHRRLVHEGRANRASSHKARKRTLVTPLTTIDRDTCGENYGTIAPARDLEKVVGCCGGDSGVKRSQSELPQPSDLLRRIMFGARSTKKVTWVLRLAPTCHHRFGAIRRISVWTSPLPQYSKCGSPPPKF